VAVTFSIVIPHFNGERILAECLDSLFRSKGSYTVILVDNGSSDQSIPQTRVNFPSVQIVSPDENLGYAGGCSFGASYASGDFLVFLNNDTQVEPDWLIRLEEFITLHPDAVILQPKILSLQEKLAGKKVFDYAGGAGGRLDIFGYPFAWGRIMAHVETDSGQYDEPRLIFWASGTAMVIKRKIAVEHEYFDSGYFAHMEEIDLCWRVQAHDLELWSVPASVVYHLGGQTLAFGNPKKLYLNHRNNWYLLFKNTPIWFFSLIFIPRIALDLIAWGVYSLQKGKDGFKVIPSAWFWLWRNKNFLIEVKRKNIDTVKQFGKLVLPRLSLFPVIFRSLKRT